MRANRFSWLCSGKPFTYFAVVCAPVTMDWLSFLVLRLLSYPQLSRYHHSLRRPDLDHLAVGSVTSNEITFNPDITITHSGGEFPDYDEGPIIMDELQTLTTARASTDTFVVAVHMEAWTFALPAVKHSVRWLMSQWYQPAGK